MLILHEQVFVGGPEVLISGFVAIAESNVMQEDGKVTF
jgi:hypothetical protein